MTFTPIVWSGGPSAVNLSWALQRRLGAAEAASGAEVAPTERGVARPPYAASLARQLERVEAGA
jgi:hypothetical protein